MTGFIHCILPNIVLQTILQCPVDKGLAIIDRSAGITVLMFKYLVIKVRHWGSQLKGVHKCIPLNVGCKFCSQTPPIQCNIYVYGVKPGQIDFLSPMTMCSLTAMHCLSSGTLAKLGWTSANFLTLSYFYRLYSLVWSIIISIHTTS